MDRPIAPNEIEVVNWLLDHASVDAEAYRVRPVEDLRVVGGCGCGCTSLDFKPRERREGKAVRIADELALYPDGQRAGLILWGRNGEIASLEIYDFDPGSSHRFPEVGNLCTWEEMGRRSG
ncbi:MAG TPA: hypothetical protein VF753_13755 [Terriglobales bacterium]